MKPKVTVVGAGFSGLTLAYFLVKKGLHVEILEAERVGGLISTLNLGKMKVESAANAFLNSVTLQELSKDISCELVATLPQAKNRFIWRDRPRRWPLSIKSTLLLIRRLPFLLWSKSRIGPNETVETWALRVFNREILNYLIAPALQGIYAGDVKNMSASLLIGPILDRKSKAKMPKNFRRGSVSPCGGMGEWVDKLKSHLLQKGVTFTFQKVDSLNEVSRPVAMAVPLWQAQKFQPALKSAEALPLTRATIRFDNPQKKVGGFGVLFPPCENFNSLGVLSNTETFPNRGSEYNESWILGGALQPDINEKSEAECLKKILEDRARAFGASDPVAEVHWTRWTPALPHYTVDLEAVLKNVEQGHDQVYWTGNYLGKIGLSRILDFNKTLAEQIATESECLHE